MLIFSDLHLKMESRAVCAEVLEGALQTALELGEKVIVFLGDWYHLRYAVPVVLQNMVTDWVAKVHAAGMELIILPGNHDQVDELGTNALEVFGSIEGVRVYSEPTVDEYGAWLPYRKPDLVPGILKSLKAQTKKVHKKAMPLFAHLPIKGALMNNLRADEHGIPAAKFRGFEKVLLGHYHKQQDLAGGLHYVGSPWQTRADEWGQDKGFARWDGETLTRINIVYGPRYHRCDLATAALQAPDWAPGDIVKIKVSPDDGGVTDELKAWAAEQPATIVLEDTAEHVVQPRFAFREGTTLAEYVSAYMKDHAGSCDPNALWAMWGELQ